MKTSINQYLILLTGLAVMFFFTGCAITQDHIRLTYVPQSGVTKIVGTNFISVQVLMTDSRAIRDKVSAKKNGFGMEMASIVSDDDVPGMVKFAIETEPENRGFHVQKGEVTLAVDLSKFYSNFEIHFWSGTAVAEASIEAKVKDTNGQILYSKLIVGNGEEGGCQLASGYNAKLALDRALHDLVVRLFSDNDFIVALEKVRKVQ